MGFECRAIFLWLCSKDLTRLTFDKVKKDSPEEILTNLRRGQTTYAVVFDILCRFVAKAMITIAIRLRYDDTTTHSTTTEVIEITICVRFDCDTTTIRLRRIAHACFHSTRFDASKK